MIYGYSLHLTCFFYLFLTFMVFWLVISLVHFVQKKRYTAMTERYCNTLEKDTDSVASYLNGTIESAY